ncbi:hypothetical protein GCM10009718_35490 [Isoptericola halotolerans]|uniref:Uncharacterized protein n=1 Tax=Isoptericola halotolerans TaxID=300560 RepID=A0ABX2A2V9_9MICO|nr:hypothetical protein [Isoptericola halotolerans]NOV97195.1 hypothetical protein [Isoptericola halotolerans]
MNTEDEAYQRLAAADPAADAEPRAEVLRAKADALAAAPAQDVPPGGDEVSVRRSRRRTPWLVAAGVAGAVALGGGGYALGASGAGEMLVAGDRVADQALPPITLGGGRAGAESGADSAAGATEEGASDAATTDIGLPGWYDGRAVFSARGLSGEAGAATAYAYDAREVGTAEGAARLAEALGVEGEPRWEWGAWHVGPRDGQGAGIWLSADGTAYFSYNDPAADPWRCDDLAAETRQQDAEGGTDDMILPADCGEPAALTISPQDAVDEVRDLMERVGVDPEGFVFDAPDDSDEGAVWVTAEQVVDGQRTGSSWSATVGDAGVSWLDGFLAETVPLGDYPVVSAAEAVERLGDPRFGGSSWPVTYAAGTEVMLEERYEDEDGSEPSAPPAPPSSGSDLPWPVSDVVITDARLGLTQHHDDGGSVMLLPAYELSDAAGNTWSVLAVAEEALDTTSS